MRIVCKEGSTYGCEIYNENGEDITQEIKINSMSLHLTPDGLLKANIVCYLDEIDMEILKENILVENIKDKKD